MFHCFLCILALNTFRSFAWTVYRYQALEELFTIFLSLVTEVAAAAVGLPGEYPPSTAAQRTTVSTNYDYHEENVFFFAVKVG